MQQLPPSVLQVVGLILVVGGALFWAATGRDSPELISAGVALATAGIVAQVAKKNGGQTPPPTASTGHTSWVTVKHR